MEVKKMGNIYGFTGGCYAGNVYDDNGLAPNFNGMEGGNRQPMIVAMRGRNPDNPSDRRAGIELEQRLEPQKEGICNTLTSVNKDNLLIEPCKYVGNINPSDRGMGGEVTDTNGISRTLTVGHSEPNKILIRQATDEVKAIDEQNMCVRTETFGTLTTDGSSPKHNNRVLIKQATDKGYIECKIGGVADLSFPNSTTRRGRVQDDGDVSPGLTVSGVDGICRIEEPKVLGGIGEKKSNGGSQYFQQDRVYTSDGLAMSHPAQIPGGSYKYMSDYRIRKLTPLECWRLMGFSDEEFHKAEKVNSNTQLYKQAGNSIVVDVLQYIFKEIFEPTEKSKKGQMSIFDLDDCWR